MDREQYNGHPPQTRVVKAGTEFHRISASGSGYPPNSFNHATPKPLGDEGQGRFEPIDTTHGGYLYVTESLAGAVAEGLLRGVRVPAGGILRRKWIVGKTHTVMVLERDIEVTVLMDGALPVLGLTSTLTSCFREDYSWSRATCHEILNVSANTDGVIYRCRHNQSETALMLLDRGGLDSSHLRVVSSQDILSDRSTLEDVCKVAAEDFHLQYVTGHGGRRI